MVLRAALAVVPSRVETFGLAAAEAGLHGVPLLCADIPALQELLGEEAAEWFPAGDSRKLAAGIATLLGDRSRREALSRMAAERIGTRLAWPEQLPAWEVAWSEFSRREFT